MSFEGVVLNSKLQKGIMRLSRLNHCNSGKLKAYWLPMRELRLPEILFPAKDSLASAMPEFNKFSIRAEISQQPWYTSQSFLLLLYAEALI